LLGLTTFGKSKTPGSEFYSMRQALNSCSVNDHRAFA
jgi:hypothetical protein